MYTKYLPGERPSRVRFPEGLPELCYFNFIKIKRKKCKECIVLRWFLVSTTLEGQSLQFLLSCKYVREPSGLFL